MFSKVLVTRIEVYSRAEVVIQCILFKTRSFFHPILSKALFDQYCYIFASITRHFKSKFRHHCVIYQI
jgi:hypothetical protein